MPEVIGHYFWLAGLVRIRAAGPPSHPFVVLLRECSRDYRVRFRLDRCYSRLIEWLDREIRRTRGRQAVCRVCRVVIDNISAGACGSKVRTCRLQRVHVYRQTMAGPRVCRLFVVLGYLSLVLVLAQNPVEEKTTFEAAFQGESAFSIARGNFMNFAFINSGLWPLVTLDGATHVPVSV